MVSAVRDWTVLLIDLCHPLHVLLWSVESYYCVRTEWMDKHFVGQLKMFEINFIISMFGLKVHLLFITTL